MGYIRRNALAYASLVVACGLGTVTDPASGQARTATLSGRVVEASARTPVASAVIELKGRSQRVLTDSAGRFAFTGVPAGRVQLTASALGYRDTTTFAEAGNNGVVIAITLKPIPLPALHAMAGSRSYNLPGARMFVFGRDQLLAAGDLSALFFVQRNAQLRSMRRCASFDWGRSLDATDPIALTARDVPQEFMAYNCMRGVAGHPIIVRVFIDGERNPRTSDELYDYRAWDLARVQVLRGAGSMGGGGVAMVFLYTKEYVERQAAGRLGLCALLATMADSVAQSFARNCR
jgi:hypothetical protein